MDQVVLTFAAGPRIFSLNGMSENYRFYLEKIAQQTAPSKQQPRRVPRRLHAIASVGQLPRAEDEAGREHRRSSQPDRPTDVDGAGGRGNEGLNPGHRQSGRDREAQQPENGARMRHSQTITARSRASRPAPAPAARRRVPSGRSPAAS